MPVNLVPPDPQQLSPVRGASLGVTEAGIRKSNRKDLLVIRLEPGARVAGVFTQMRKAGFFKPNSRMTASFRE